MESIFSISKLCPLNQNPISSGVFAMFHSAVEDSGKCKTIFSLG